MDEKKTTLAVLVILNSNSNINKHLQLVNNSSAPICIWSAMSIYLQHPYRVICLTYETKNHLEIGTCVKNTLLKSLENESKDVH